MTQLWKSLNYLPSANGNSLSCFEYLIVTTGCCHIVPFTGMFSCFLYGFVKRSFCENFSSSKGNKMILISNPILKGIRIEWTDVHLSLGGVLCAKGKSLRHRSKCISARSGHSNCVFPVTICGKMPGAPTSAVLRSKW